MARPGNTQYATRNSKICHLAPLLLDWFSRTARDLPWRRTRDPYAIWVSEIMLQQTQVKTVMPYWERWMQSLPALESLARADSDKIHKLWEGLGYYTRVRNMQKAAQKIRDEHGGKFPETFGDVLALPGIGRYTAGAICSIAFNLPTPILDGNVIRVLTRVFGIEGDPREKRTNEHLWQLARDLVETASRFKPPVSDKTHHAKRNTPSCSHLNQSLMELGALICTPRLPKCTDCPARRICVAFRDNRTAELPEISKRTPATAREFAAFVCRKGDRFLVRQRPAGVVNAHLWEFPNVEIFSKNSDWRAAGLSALGFSPRQLHPLCTIKHSITRYRITLEALIVTDVRMAKTVSTRGSWLPLADLKHLSFPSAHKKILAALEELKKAPR